MSENLEHHGKSLAAPIIFLIVAAFQFFSRYLEVLKKYGSKSKEEIKLRAEIKQLLKEATIMSQPATFAQAAKLRRIATAKEKDLARIIHKHGNVAQHSFDTYAKGLMIVKVLTYIMLILWFWRMPVAAISERLVQPFGKILSWRAGGTVNDNVMVGIIPWLVVSTRVSKIMIRKVLNRTWF